jgi:hypothetical protein
MTNLSLSLAQAWQEYGVCAGVCVSLRDLDVILMAQQIRTDRAQRKH